MVRLDDLQYKGLMLYQDTEADRFSEDAVRLANFLRFSPRDTVVDLGAGNGILSILGAGKTGAAFTGVDRQESQIALAKRSAALNGQAVSFYTMDIADAPAFFGHGSFSGAVMNPPYFAGHGGDNASRAAARHGDATALFLRAAFLLLKNGGRLFLCYPAGGLVDALCLLRANRLEPKRIRPFAFDATGAPRRFLLEARKGGKPGLIWENCAD